jgi:uncharacterized membrane protein
MSQIGKLKTSRIESLTDGIFAIAMTILVLNVSVPQHLSESSLWLNLRGDILYKLFIYAGSFVILGTQWIGMDFQHGFLERVTRTYLWTNILFLMLICLLPFSASILASYPHTSVSIYVYAGNLILIGISQLITWCYAQLNHLNVEGASSHDVSRALYKRVCISLGLYITAFIVAYWNTTIAFVILIVPPFLHLIPGAVDKYVRD